MRMRRRWAKDGWGHRTDCSSWRRRLVELLSIKLKVMYRPKWRIPPFERNICCAHDALGANYNALSGILPLMSRWRCSPWLRWDKRRCCGEGSYYPPGIDGRKRAHRSLGLISFGSNVGRNPCCGISSVVCSERLRCGPAELLKSVQ